MWLGAFYRYPMKYPYSIKNWRQSDEYPSSGEELSTEEWAWEFTRRNADYQKHWDIFKRLPDSSPGIGIKNGKWKGTPVFDHPLDSYSGYVDPAPVVGETLAEYEQRNSEAEYIIEPYQDYIARKFGVYPTNPRLDGGGIAMSFRALSENHEDPLPLEIFLPTTSEPVNQRQFMDQIETVRSSIERPVVLVFDLQRALERQTDEALVLLRERLDMAKALDPSIKRKQNKQKPDLYPVYLRVLDARAEGATFRTIAENLYPSESEAEDRLKKHHRAAKSLSIHFPYI